jgi:hypothetical protein
MQIATIKMLLGAVVIIAGIIFRPLPVTEIQATQIELPPEIPEIPQILKDIAQCESKSRQFNEDGSVHMGEINPLDTGKWQINQKYHLAKSQELGMDIFTLEGNTAYAIYLYETEGTTPWNWSKDCWGKK